MTDDRTPDQPEDSAAPAKKEPKADPFAGLTIDFRGGAVDAVPLGGNGAHGSGAGAGAVPTGGGNLGGPIAFGSPIVFDAPAPAVEARPGHPGGEASGADDRDPSR